MCPDAAFDELPTSFANCNHECLPLPELLTQHQGSQWSQVLICHPIIDQSPPLSMIQYLGTSPMHTIGVASIGTGNMPTAIFPAAGHLSVHKPIGGQT